MTKYGVDIKPYRGMFFDIIQKYADRIDTIDK
jgi:hypothetical protein